MARRPPQRYGSRGPVVDLDPRVLGTSVTVLVLATYTALQLTMTRSSVNFLWWRTEQVRVAEHFRFPKAPNPAPAGKPTWQEWVPTAMTAVLVTAALIALAILVVRSGRGLWLLLVAALPLVPVELGPGVWAPPLANASAYALVFPPGAIQPDTLWAWMEASLQSMAVILPAFVIGRVLPVRSARLWGGEVLSRFVVPAVVAGAVVGWNVALGLPVDWGMLARTSVLLLIGGLVITGTRSPWLAVVGLATLPALAGGLVAWTTDVSGQALVVTDPSAWRNSVVALIGAAWMFVQPRLAAIVVGAYGIWRAALHSQVADAVVDDEAEIEVEAEVDVADAVEDVPEVIDATLDEPATDDEATDEDPLEGEDGELVAVPAGRFSRRRARAAATPVGGRHRA